MEEQLIEKKRGVKPTHKCVRCQFVSDFVAGEGLSMTEAGEILGMTRSSFWHCVSVVDDMKLSQVDRLFEARGFRVRMQIVRPGDEKLEDIATADDLVIGTDGRVRLKRTSFILLAMKRYKVGKYELCEKYLQPRIQYSSFRRMLDLDDMYLSRTYSIAEAMGANLVIDIMPAAPVPEPEGKSLCIVNYVSKKIQVIE